MKIFQKDDREESRIKLSQGIADRILLEVPEGASERISVTIPEVTPGSILEEILSKITGRIPEATTPEVISEENL